MAVALIVLFGMGWAICSAQPQWGGSRFGRGGGGRYAIKTAARRREQDIMQKAIDPAFKDDVFIFARLKFDSDLDEPGRGRIWDDDTPEADLNVIYRLFEATSLKIQPGLNFVDITTKDLAEHPFVYMAGSGRVAFSAEEAATLRAYMLNGGFIMADDFWGDDQWAHFSAQLKLIFPDRAPELMDLKHPIFGNVYPFQKQPQIPSVFDFFQSGQSFDINYPYEQMTHDPHYYGVYDDKHRLVMLICHNNHYGDGWEHEGDDQTYFNIFSLPMGYPMLINVLTYVMSH
jgi:hypothetical protein